MGLIGLMIVSWLGSSNSVFVILIVIFNYILSDRSNSVDVETPF